MEEVFQPVWLFPPGYPAEPGQVVEDQARYDEMLESGYWKPSPADHGYISAPSEEQLMAMRMAGTAPAALLPPVAPLSSGVSDISTLSDRVLMLESQMRVMHDALASAGRHYDEMEQQLSAMERRVAALQSQASHGEADDRPHDTGHGRRR